MEKDLLQPKNNFKLSAIILCAGEGIRFKEITKDIPKPLIKIESLNNISILHHSINNLFFIGIEQIAIIIGHLGSKIDNFITSLKKKESSLEEKLVIIDAGTQYKLGPLYSFLSITRYERFFKKEQNKQLYIVIPGDTIFELALLKEIIALISANFNLIQKNPTLFYQKVEVKALKKKHENKVSNSRELISIVEIEKKGSKQIFKGITKQNVKNLHDSDNVKQLIPVLVFSYNFINEIMELKKNDAIKTISKILNIMARKGREINAINITNELNFYDIDNKIDLIKFENIKKKRKG
ncbi:MAG: sugar phosphate nucleotidyltransferase [Promethearchaeota archaeon]